MVRRTKKIIYIVGGVTLGFLLVMFIMEPDGDKPSFFKGSLSGQNDKFITYNPLDLTQTKALSKFRSCIGHDYSGQNIDGESETNRSMKNYIEPIDSLAQTTQQVKALAPFDGEISEIESDQDPRGVQIWLTPDTGGNWQFIFFHIDPLPHMIEGTKVSAGELIGYANLTGSDNFDIALKTFSGFSQKFASVFDYMDASVIQQYETRGLTAANITVTKEVRDAEPCDFGVGSGNDDWVTLI